LFSLARYWIRKGDAARDAHQWEAAQRAYGRALLRNPKRAGIWVQYGHVLKEGGRLAEALAAYRQADQLKPGVPDTLEHLSHLAEMLRQSLPLHRHERTDEAARLTPEQLALAAVLRMDMWEVARAVQLERLSPVTLDDIRTLPPHEIALRLRSQAFFWPTAEGVGLCRTICGRLIFVDPRDLRQSTHLINNGCLDLPTTTALARMVEPGMVVADIGANLGFSAVLLAEAVGANGQVLAFEPDPAVARLLQRTVSLNGYDGIVIVGAHAVAARSASATAAQANVVPLDDVLPPHVDFVRIDAEGAEGQVWAGLRGIVGANPRIRIALTLNAARAPQGMMPLLTDIQSRGFPLRFIDDAAEIKPCDASFVMGQAPRDITLMLTRP
jgi:hypothetical protein